MIEKLATPVGRLVQGSFFEPNTKDFYGKPLTKKDGTPREEWYMALAIPKRDERNPAAENPQWVAFRAALLAECQKSFKEYQFGIAPNGALTSNKPGFAFKIIDGDSTELNQKNNKPCDNEGFAGNWVVRFTTGIKPKVVTYDASTRVETALGPEDAKRGSYYRLGISVNANTDAANPGLFLNAVIAQWVAYGEPIVSTNIDAADVFSDPIVLPAGASSLPVVGNAPGIPSTPTASVPPPVVNTTVAPAPDFLNPVVTPSAPPAPPAPVVEEKYMYQGLAYTKTALLAAGWPEATILTLPKA